MMLMKWLWPLLLSGTLILGGYLLYSNYKFTMTANKVLTEEVVKANDVVESSNRTLDAYTKAYEDGRAIRAKGNTEKRRAIRHVRTEQSKAPATDWLNQPVDHKHVKFLLE